MPLVLNAEVGSATANSYCTVAEANAYHDFHVAETVWESAAGASNNVQVRALVMATRLLDEQYDWIGTKATAEQALRWPRVGAMDRDGYPIAYDELPRDLIRATAELARYLLAGNRFDAIDDAQSGIEEVRAGSVMVKFTQATQPMVIPASVAAMLAALASGMAGDLSVPLVRV